MSEPSNPDAERALAPGHALGRYRVLEPLGHGGSGRVYLAERMEQASDDGRFPPRQRVALKVMWRALVDHRVVVERFMAESLAVSRISHPAIIEIFDVFLADGTPCIAMEHLEGRTLLAEIEQGALAPARVAAIGAEVARALAATHAAGVVHRDLKPANIFLLATGDRPAIKVLDFGVAKLAPAEHQAALTAGSILGTPEYMAPEQLAGKPVDARTDIYALGATLYHACAGQPPFAGRVLGELVIKHLTQPPPPLRAPPSLVDAIFAMLAKEPTERPSSMRDVERLLAV